MSDKKTILLVDDDEAFLTTSKIILEKNYHIMTAVDGKQCFAQISIKKPDLLIIDVMLRYLSEGLELAKELKSRPDTKDIPVIMLSSITGNTHSSNHPAQSHPADLWLEKPVEPSLLVKEVNRILSV